MAEPAPGWWLGRNGFGAGRGDGLKLALPATVIGAAAGFLVMESDPWYLAAGLVMAPLALYVLAGHTFEKLMLLLALSLPFQAAFVLNLGMTVRLSHLLGGAAVAVGLYLHRICRVPLGLPWWVLGAFLFVAICSLSFTPMIPAVSRFVLSGVRGLEIRPIVQIFQLISMVILMFLTVGFCRDSLRFSRVADLVTISTALVLAYGVYKIVADLIGIPYIDINNAMNSDYTFGYREQGNSFAGVYIPRPRSTFVEPLNFANFLLFALPLTAASLAERHGRVGRISKLVVIAIGFFLFIFFISSRGAFYGAAVAGLALAAFLRRLRGFLAYVGWLTASALVIFGCAYLVIAVLIPGLDAVDFLWTRVWTATTSGGRVSEDWATFSPLFAQYPWFGVGFGNVPFYMSRLERFEHEGVVDAGGMWTRLLVETGIVGTALFALFLCCLLWGLWRVSRGTSVRRWRAYAIAISFSIIADAVQRVSFPGLATDVNLWVMFGLGLAIMNMAGQDDERPASLAEAEVGTATPRSPSS